MSIPSRVSAVVVLFCSVSHAQVPHTGEQQSNQRPSDSRWHWQLALASHYLSEGRDNLDGEPLSYLSAEWGQLHWSTGLWVARSPGVNYTEGQAYLAYTRTVHVSRGIPLEWYVNYARTEVREEGGDNECATGLSWTAPSEIWELALDSTYSMASSGQFTEITGRYQGQKMGWLAAASLAAHIGWNGGYVAEGHRGWNHWSLDLQWPVRLSSSWQLATTVGYTHPLNRQASRPDDRSLMTGFFLELAWQRVNAH